jgi:hypothetical protein
VEGKGELRIEEFEGFDQGEFWAEIRGIGQFSRHAPHEYLDALLGKAVDTIPDGEEGPFEMHTTVYVKHSSPGWWDGFRVSLTGGSG